MWYNDFPYWLRFAHFINLIFLTLLIRSGIEILSAMPKLYWHDHATPGTEWIMISSVRRVRIYDWGQTLFTITRFAHHRK